MSTGGNGSSSVSRVQWLAYAALCLILGSPCLGIRVAVHAVPPLRAAALRFVAAGILLLVLALLQKRSWPRAASQWNSILVLGVTMMGLPYCLLFWAEQHVMSSMTAALYSAMPLTVSLFTPAMMHLKVPRPAIYAMVVGFGAFLSLFLDLRPSRWALIGGLAVLISMTLSSWSVVYAKLRLREVDTVVATGLQLLFGSVVSLWGTWALEAHRPAQWTMPALLGLTFLAIFGSAAAFVIYYWLLKRFQPYQLSTISLIAPLIALIEGWLAGERIHLIMPIAVIVVLVSVRLVLLAEADKPDILILRDRIQ